MVCIRCPGCGKIWVTKAKGNAVRCGGCGAIIRIGVTGCRGGKRKSSGFLSNWGGIEEKGGGFLSNWGGF